MSGNITVVSTTDSQEAVEAAATAYEGDTLVTPVSEAEQPSGSVGGVNITRNVASTTDTQEQVEEVQRDIDETKEERKEEYLDGLRPGKTRAKLLRWLSRNALRERGLAYPVSTVRVRHRAHATER